MSISRILGILIFVTGGLMPMQARGQSLQLKLDIKALQALIDTNLGGTYHLTGPFSMEDLAVTSIKNGKVYGTFDLLFDGSISIPIPFYGKKTISLSKTFTMSYNFIPDITKGVLTIPVKSIGIQGGGVRFSLGSRSINALVSLKRFLMSNRGQSLLDKTVRIDFQSILKKHLGYKKWKVSLLLGTNSVVISGRAMGTARARGRE